VLLLIRQISGCALADAHSRRGKFPANLVAEIANVFDSTGVRGMPA
jgi:hypothetical protein